MAEQVHLKNAPIKEALIDIRVRGVTAERLLGVLPKEFVTAYPRLERLNFHEFKIQANDSQEMVSTAVTRDTGFRAFSKDERLIVQFRQDGFTLSCLPPYKTWEDLRDEAKRLWAMYLNLAKPELVSRIALRYVNQINLPLSLTDFGEYLTMSPVLPDAMPQALSSFLMRYVIPFPNTPSTAIFTQALEAPTDLTIPVILDIDVFEDRVCGTEDGECWSALDELRKIKNTIFFESITEKTKGMYV